MDDAIGGDGSPTDDDDDDDDDGWVDRSIRVRDDDGRSTRLTRLFSFAAQNSRSSARERMN
jgi:hypothetical protein